MRKKHPADSEHATRPPQPPAHEAAGQQQTANPALWSRAGGRGNGVQQAAAIQRMQETMGNRAVQRVLAAPSNKAATATLEAAREVLQNGSLRMLAHADPAYAGALRDLYKAHTGVVDENTSSDESSVLTGGERLSLLTTGLNGLRPVLTEFDNDPGQQRWADYHIHGTAERLRIDLNMQLARERVDGDTPGTDDAATALPSNAAARSPSGELRSSISKTVKTLSILRTQAARFGSDAIKEGMEALEKGGKPQGWGNLSKLGEIGNVLMLADGYLTLSDKEFQKRLTNIQGVFNGVATYSDLVKAVVGIIGGTVGVMASVSAVLARAAGQMELVTESLKLARGGIVAFGHVLAAVELIHGVAVVLDSTATADQKIDAVRDIAIGSAVLAGKWAGKAAVGAAAGGAIMVTYLLALGAAGLFNSSRQGIMGGWATLAFATIDHDGVSISQKTERLAKTGILLAEETDPAQVAALTQLEQETAEQLGITIDSFLDKCEPTGYEVGSAYKPGAFPPLAAAFAPLQTHRGARTPETAGAAGIAVLEKLAWFNQNRDKLMNEAAGAPPDKTTAPVADAEPPPDKKD